MDRRCRAATDVPNDDFRGLDRIGGEGAKKAQCPQPQGEAKTIVVLPIQAQPLAIAVVQLEAAGQIEGRWLASEAAVLGTERIGQELYGYGSASFSRWPIGVGARFWPWSGGFQDSRERPDRPPRGFLIQGFGSKTTGTPGSASRTSGPPLPE